MPTRLEWDGLQLNYKRQLERKLLRAASNSDDLDAANETDEAAVADQKALPITIPYILLLYLFITLLLLLLYIRAHCTPLLNWIFNRLYLSIDPISRLIYRTLYLAFITYYATVRSRHRLKNLLFTLGTLTGTVAPLGNSNYPETDYTRIIGGRLNVIWLFP